MDVMDVQNTLNFASNNTFVAESTASHHILSGSFRSLSLFLLAFSPSKRSLSHIQTIPAYGPHQYLAANGRRDRIYTTSWALPPSLSSWHVERTEQWRVTHINTVPITATSSYITVPPPFSRIYSAGGPTGEVHLVDPSTGGFDKKIQQILFVPESELATADKTRVALRYGSHGIEFTPSLQLAFAPVLGSSTIEMFSHDRATGILTHITSVPSPRGADANDGPRHVKIHPNGKVLYCVTEHSNLVDAYRILPTSLVLIASRSLLPQSVADSKSTSSPSSSEHHFRGDTLLLSPSTPSNPVPRVLITTTRGSTTDSRGWLSIFPLDTNGYFINLPNSSQGFDEAERFQTPTSGGKANAIDILPKSLYGGDEDGLWILLTDDDDATASPTGSGAVRVLEWNGWKKGSVQVVAEWPQQGASSVDNAKTESESIRGASHAIWLD
ncbi:Lactonase, 7-bladed beta-propeller-domain-containing protein [Crassisporium funariophilum]|nr:Lactonase, 7-bladed beta-propeller-domain-containing protein [Crassisporium funariophilum]